MKIVHDIIYQELVSCIINEASREQYKTIIRRMTKWLKAAEGNILGCTEIMLLISQSDCAALRLIPPKFMPAVVDYARLTSVL